MRVRLSMEWSAELPGPRGQSEVTERLRRSLALLDLAWTTWEVHWSDVDPDAPGTAPTELARRWVTAVATVA